MDHYLQIMGDPAGPMLEGYTTLGFLAAHTRTVELQPLVTGVTYRHPGLLIKIVSTMVARYADACNLFARPDGGRPPSGPSSTCWPSTAPGKAPTTTGSARASCGSGRWRRPPPAAPGSLSRCAGTPRSALTRCT